MAGIVGAAGGAAPLDHADLVDRMATRLVRHADTCFERWVMPGLAAVCAARADKNEDGPRPLVSDRTGVCLTLFGECVGYDGDKRELERRGHAFSDGRDSDSEYVLRLYEEHGRGAFTLLSGSFCLALFDPRTHEFLLVSDRLGSRPLFHALGSKGVLAFSTQASPVLDCPGVTRSLDREAILEFCASQRVFGTKTYHQGVSMLPPASVLCHRDGRVSIEAYRTLDYCPVPGSVDDYADELATVVRRAVGRLQRGRRRTALLLSGGLDARMILAAAESELTCYTFGDYENFETEVARHVATIKGFPFRFLQRPADHYADLLASAVEIGSGMHPFNHAHALGFIDEIRKDCDTVTHGYGTEILFRGTSLPRRPHRVFGIAAGSRLDEEFGETQLRARLLQRSYTLVDKGMRDLLTPNGRQSLDAQLSNATAALIASSQGHAANVYDAFLWPDIYYRGRFPSFLFEMSMRPYVSERSIDFDNEVIDLHLRMPANVRCGNRLWLRAMERLDRKVAHAVTANTGYSPFVHPLVASLSDRTRALVGRPSRRARGMQAARTAAGSSAAGGSPISWPRFDAMIRENPKLRSAVTATLTDPRALSPDIFDHARIRQLLDNHLDGRAHARDLIFALLTLGQWCMKYAP